MSPSAFQAEPWVIPSVTDHELRAAGFSSSARDYPHSESGARWIAAFNGIPFEKMPAAWCYAANAYMLDYVERCARDEQTTSAEDIT